MTTSSTAPEGTPENVQQIQSQAETTSSPQEVTTSAVDSGSNQQQVDWEARYKGLQRTFDLRTKELDNSKLKIDELTQELESLRQNSRQSVSEIESLKEKFQALETEKRKIEEDLAAQRSLAERTKVIMSKFPELASFEAQGLLPASQTTEELEQKLETFRKAIGETVDKTAMSKLQGFTPPDTANNKPPAAPSKESIYGELLRLAGRTDNESRARYSELVKLWDDLYESNNGG